MTRFVLSPLVATTTASASGTPARRRISASIPWPTMNPPAQRAPRRARASSCSSIAVTSQPSSARSRATAEPTLPQPITTSFMASGYVLEHTLRERDDEHLAGGAPEHVIDGRREERGLAPPARRRADDDQIGSSLHGLVDDRPAERARADGHRLDADAVLLAEQHRLGERRGRLLLEPE